MAKKKKTRFWATRDFPPLKGTGNSPKTYQVIVTGGGSGPREVKPSLCSIIGSKIDGSFSPRIKSRPSMGAIGGWHD